RCVTTSLKLQSPVAPPWSMRSSPISATMSSQRARSRSICLSSAALLVVSVIVRSFRLSCFYCGYCQLQLDTYNVGSWHSQPSAERYFLFVVCAFSVVSLFHVESGWGDNGQ